MIFLRMFSGCMLQLTPFAFLCIYPFIHNLRFPLKKTILLALGLMLSVSAVFAAACCCLKEKILPSQTLFISANIAFLGCLLPCIAAYLYVVTANWQKKVFLLFVTLNLALSMTSFGTVISTGIRVRTSYDGLPYAGSAILVLLLLTAVFVPLYLLFLHYFYCPVAEDLNNKECGYLSILSILLFLLMASGLIPLDYDHIYNPFSLFLYLALNCASFFIYIVCFKLLAQIHKRLAAQQMLDQAQFQLEIRDEQYKRILGAIESSRKSRHDAKHHFVTLQKLMDTGDLENARKYLSEYTQSLYDFELVTYCENAVINILVSHYRAQAQEYGIRFINRIQIPKDLGIPDSDISVLLGNLLENAIEASVRACEQARYISLNIIISGKMLVIAVDNGFDGKVRVCNHHYLSMKENHQGIGLQSIQNIAAKYNGGIDFSHEDNIFHSSVMMTLE